MRKRLVAASVLLGLGSARAQIPVHDLNGVPNEGFGSSIAFLPDVDDDGVGEIAVGAPFGSGGSSGNVRVYSGSSGLVLHTFQGASGDRFGTSVAPAGDIDGDGYGDLACGAPQPGGANPGYVAIHSVRTGALVRVIVGEQAASEFGRAIAGGHDVDLDGVDDLLIGAPRDGNQNQGKLHVHSGATGLELRQNRGDAEDRLGWAVQFYGDTDGDGIAEYAASGPGLGSLSFNGSSGVVKSYRGSDGEEQWSKTFSSALFQGDEFGWALCAVGDFNGDGASDLAASSREFGVPSYNPGNGIVRVLSGVDGAVLRQIVGNSNYAGLGMGLAGLGDTDGDGLVELAVGVPGVEPSDPHAPVRIYESGTNPPVQTLAPAWTADELGSTLAAAPFEVPGIVALAIGDPGVDRVTVVRVLRSAKNYCTAQINSLGCAATIVATGSASVSGTGPFTLGASQLLNNKIGFLFYGFAPIEKPFHAGTLCVERPRIRTGVQGTGGNPPPDDCSGAITYDFRQRIQSGADPQLVEGRQVFAQIWSRDSAAQAHSQLTDAIAFTIMP